jgi:hypothetical protein
MMMRWACSGACSDNDMHWTSAVVSKCNNAVSRSSLGGERGGRAALNNDESVDTVLAIDVLDSGAVVFVPCCYLLLLWPL